MRTNILMFGVAALTAAVMTGRAADAADAKTNYTKYCRLCHGEDGKAQTGMGKTLKIRDFTDPKVQESSTDEKISKTIKEGVKKDDRVVMKGFSEKLTDDEVKALVKYVRDFKGKS
jgi:cytochrome c553